MQCSAEINEIAAALAAAQGIIKNPGKTRENTYFNSKYADLAGGLDCIRPALSANGIAIVQATSLEKDGVALTTRLVHTSGQYVGCVYPVAAVAVDHQKLGAALTYARRQALFALVGVCGEGEDDDGEGCKGNGNGSGTVKEAPITDAQVTELRTKIDTCGANEQRFLKYLRIGALSALPATEFQRAIAALNAKGAKS